MSGGGRSYTRRSVAVGGAVAVALGLAAVGINAPRWLRAKTAYDDLLNQLVDRDAAETVGHAVVGQTTFDTKTTAADLRQRLTGRSLSEVSKDDLAHNRLIEAKGWVMPQTLGLLCALAASPG